MKLKLN